MDPTHTITDVLIIGAGPCGLFQAFQLGLQGIDCNIVEALEYPGGQCAELYPDKPIFDIPAIPRTQAQNLTEQLLMQIHPFRTSIHYGQIVDSIDPLPTGKYKVTTNTRAVFICRCVVLATGAGAFSAVQMRLDGIDSFNDKQLFYGDVQPAQLSGKNVVVTGDTPSAVLTAINASEYASQTALVHRKRRLQTDEQSRRKLDRLVESKRVKLIKGKISGFHASENLDYIDVDMNACDSVKVDVDIILARLGNSPKAAALEQWGIDAKQHHAQVDPASCETSAPGIFAVGDINTYPGKRKLILCGFHEATLAAFAIVKTLSPEKPAHTLYTTTSTKLLKRLGVAELA